MIKMSAGVGVGDRSSLASDAIGDVGWEKGDESSMTVTSGLE